MVSASKSVGGMLITLQNYRCKRCADAGQSCIVFPFIRSMCLRCGSRQHSCSHSKISGKIRTGYLSAYRAWRAFRQMANPDLYPKPVFVSKKWRFAKDGDVPSWFRDWYDHARAVHPQPNKPERHLRAWQVRGDMLDRMSDFPVLQKDGRQPYYHSDDEDMSASVEGVSFNFLTIDSPLNSHIDGCRGKGQQR